MSDNIANMSFTDLVSKLNEIEKRDTKARRVKHKMQMESGRKNKSVKQVLKKALKESNDIIPVDSFNNKTQKSITEGEEVEETMQDRFAKFMKAERESGTEVEEMRIGLQEASAEYEYADRAFSKMSEMINMLEKMCREGGMLETKIKQAGGEERESLADMRQALSDAYEACEQAHYDALGSGDSSSGE